MLIMQCTSSNSTKVIVTQFQPPMIYTVKLINQAKKSEYSVEKLAATTCFSSLDGLKQQLHQLNPHIRDKFGYITPGHGLKGKLNSITAEQDLLEMYSVYKNKHNILLWCYVGAEDPKRKRPATTTSSKHAPTAKRSSCESTINAVQQIVEELKEKHGCKYTVERLNAWAHMINMGKHSSKDDPPDLPFFGKKKTKAVETSSPLATAINADSPTKRVGVRTQCIDQLTKWHELLKSGAISQCQYEELKGTILKDLSLDPQKE